MQNTDIKLNAPAVFATSPVTTVSKHYTFIPTTTLIDDFRKLGWEVHRARQAKARIDPQHTKHTIVLRSDKFPAFNGNYPEIIMVNSHDRTTAFSFMLGLFRLICENGLVITDKVFDSLRVRHIGYHFEDLQALTDTIVQQMPQVMATVNRLTQITLTESQQVEFAVSAFATRFKEYVADNGKVDTKSILKAVDVKELLLPVRPEDNNPTVWAVYNRIQEKLMKGGFKRIGTKDNIAKISRPITNIKLDIDVNRSLWSLANEFAAKVAA